MHSLSVVSVSLRRCTTCPRSDRHCRGAHSGAVCGSQPAGQQGRFRCFEAGSSHQRVTATGGIPRGAGSVAVDQATLAARTASHMWMNRPFTPEDDQEALRRRCCTVAAAPECLKLRVKITLHID